MQAWSVLLALGIATAALSYVEARPPVSLIGFAIIAIGFCKARIILARYLELSAAPAWLRAIDVTGAIYALLLIGLYTLPAILF